MIGRQGLALCNLRHGRSFSSNSLNCGAAKAGGGLDLRTIMLMRFAPELIANLRLLQIAVSRKFSTMTQGTSPVPISCQIPNLRERYESFGLSPHTGYFVEIGAFDGESFSNTSFLADQGWSGLYVEPVPTFCSQIKLRHLFNLNRVSIENSAMAETAGVSDLHLMGTLSTLIDPV